MIDEKNYIVSKHNDLIANVRYDLSTHEQKIVAYLASRVKKNDDMLQWHELNHRDFLTLLGTQDIGGRSRQYLKETIKTLADKSFWVKRKDKEILCRWIAKGEIDNRTTRIKLDEDLRELFLGLSKNFTQYELFWILKMTSSYSIRLYELLKMDMWKGQRLYYTLDELREKFNVVGKYSNNGTFVKKTIDIAVNEINDLTDLIVEYKKVKNGKWIIGIELYMIEKNDELKKLAIETNEQKTFNKKHFVARQIAINTPKLENNYNENLQRLEQNIEELQYEND